MLDKFGNGFTYIAPWGGMMLVFEMYYLNSWVDTIWRFAFVGALGVSLIAVRGSVLYNQKKKPSAPEYYPFNAFFALLLDFCLAEIAEDTILSGIFYVMGAICFLFWVRDLVQFNLHRPAPLDE